MEDKKCEVAAHLRKRKLAVWPNFAQGTKGSCEDFRRPQTLRTIASMNGRPQPRASRDACGLFDIVKAMHLQAFAGSVPCARGMNRHQAGAGRFQGVPRTRGMNHVASRQPGAAEAFPVHGGGSARLLSLDGSFRPVRRWRPGTVARISETLSSPGPSISACRRAPAIQAF